MASQNSAESGDSGVSGCRSVEGEFVVNSNDSEVADVNEWNNPKSCDDEQTQSFECPRRNTNLSDEECKAGSSIENTEVEDPISEQTWGEEESFLSFLTADYMEEFRNGKFTMNFNLIPAPRRQAHAHKKHDDSSIPLNVPAEPNSPCAELSPNVALPSSPHLITEASRHAPLGGTKGLDGSHQVLLDALSKSTNKENMPTSFLTVASHVCKKHFPNSEHANLKQESINTELRKKSCSQFEDSQQKQEDLSSPSDSCSMSNRKNSMVNIQVSISDRESQKPDLSQNNDSILQSNLNTINNTDMDSTILYIDSNSSNSSVTIVEKTLDQNELDNSSALRREFVNQEVTNSMIGLCSPIRTNYSVRRMSSRQFNADLDRTMGESELENRRQCTRINNSATYGNACSSPVSVNSFNQTAESDSSRHRFVGALQNSVAGTPGYCSPSSLSPGPPLHQIPHYHIRPLPEMMTSSPMKTPQRPMIGTSYIPSPTMHVSVATSPLVLANQSSNVVASSPVLEPFGEHELSTPRVNRLSIAPRQPKRIVNGLKIIDETHKHGPKIPKRDAAIHPMLLDVPEEPISGQERVHLEDFEALKVLGSGAYGTVYLVKKITGRDSGKIYAMKVVKKSTVLCKRKNAEHAITEREVFEAVRGYPFLSQMHYAFQDELCLYVVLDFLQGGEMFNLLSVKKGFTEDEIRFYAGEMILAIEKLHALGIVYRDIKLENVMLDREGHIVITDFGLSKKMVDLRTYSYCGTLEYMAPEIVENTGGGHDLMVDWWSLAVLIYELFYGESPFVRGCEKRDNAAIARRIIEVQYEFPHKISDEAEDLLRRLLAKDAKARLGAARGAVELKEHAFFASLDWEMLGNKLVTPPCLYDFNGSTDIANFCDSFTSVDLTVSASLPNTSFIWFKNFEYCAPEATVAAVVDRARSSPRIPQICDLITMKNSGVSKFFEKYDVDLTMPPVGRGSSALVFKCWSRSPKNVYAVKVLPRFIDCTHELYMLARAQKHEGILKFEELLLDDAFWYIVTEYVEGMDLHTYMKVADFSTSSEQSNRGIMRGVMLAVSHLHNKGMAHRDLKPENIAVNLDGKPKLVDFGYTCVLNSVRKAPPNFTIGYAAPEVARPLILPSMISGFKRKNLEGTFEPASKRCRGSSFQTCAQPQEDQNDPRKADMWSIGVMLYLLLSGERLRESSDGHLSNHELMILKMHQGKLKFIEDGWRHVSPTASLLVKNLLSLDPSKRMSIDEALGHSWMTGVEDLQQHHSLEQKVSVANQGSPSCANKLTVRRGRRHRDGQLSSAATWTVTQAVPSTAAQPEFKNPDSLDAHSCLTSRPSLSAEVGNALNRGNFNRYLQQEVPRTQSNTLQAGMEKEPSVPDTLSNGVVLGGISGGQQSSYEPIMTRARKRRQESPEYSQVSKVQRQMMFD